MIESLGNGINLEDIDMSRVVITAEWPSTGITKVWGKESGQVITSVVLLDELLLSFVYRWLDKRNTQDHCVFYSLMGGAIVTLSLPPVEEMDQYGAVPEEPTDVQQVMAGVLSDSSLAASTDAAGITAEVLPGKDAADTSLTLKALKAANLYQLRSFAEMVDVSTPWDVSQINPDATIDQIVATGKLRVAEEWRIVEGDASLERGSFEGVNTRTMPMTREEYLQCMGRKVSSKYIA